MKKMIINRTVPIFVPQDADLLLHLVDISNHRFEQQINSVEKILKDLDLSEKKKIMVFNKIDKLSLDEVQGITDRYSAVAISAVNSSTFKPLLDAIEKNIWDNEKSANEIDESVFKE